MAVESLAQDPRNSRQHDQRNLDAIKASLERFGQQKPIVVHDGVVVAGNGTLAAAKALGWSHIAAASTDLDGAAVKAYAIADNRTAELATWDDVRLVDTLAELRLEAPDLVVGFSENDSDVSIQEGWGSMGGDNPAPENVVAHIAIRVCDLEAWEDAISHATREDERCVDTILRGLAAIAR